MCNCMLPLVELDHRINFLCKHFGMFVFGTTREQKCSVCSGRGQQQERAICSRHFLETRNHFMVVTSCSIVWKCLQDSYEFRIYSYEEAAHLDTVVLVTEEGKAFCCSTSSGKTYSWSEGPQSAVMLVFIQTRCSRSNAHCIGDHQVLREWKRLILLPC